MDKKLSMIEVEVGLHILEEILLPEYDGINGKEFPYIIAEEIVAAEKAEKAVIAEIISTKAAVAARRKATFKAEKEYKAAKAEHIHKAALMGDKRYNGAYTPYKRERRYTFIEVAYAELEDDMKLSIEEEKDDFDFIWEIISNKNDEIRECEARKASLEEVKTSNVNAMLENFNIKFYEAAVTAHHNIKKIEDEIAELNNEVQALADEAYAIADSLSL